MDNILVARFPKQFKNLKDTGKILINRFLFPIFVIIVNMFHSISTQFQIAGNIVLLVILMVCSNTILQTKMVFCSLQQQRSFKKLDYVSFQKKLIYSKIDELCFVLDECKENIIVSPNLSNK